MKSQIYKHSSLLLVVLMLWFGYKPVANAQCYSAFPVPVLNTHCSYAIGGLCVGCFVSNPLNCATTSLSDSTRVYMLVGLGNWVRYRTMLNDTASYSASVVLKSNVGLLNLTALGAVTLRTYFNGTLQQTFSNGSLLSLQLLGGSKQKITALTNKKFDEIEIEIDNTASLLWDVSLFYAMGTNLAPLPVDWNYVKADLLKSKDLKLSWATNNEVNNKGFRVMHSTDGSVFEEIGYVAAQNQANVENAYAFVQKSPRLGMHWYRLGQEDLNGNVTYSETIKYEVVFGTKYETYIRVQPNPITTELIFESNKPVNKVEIYNHIGQCVYKETYDKVLQYSINTALFTTGSYFLKAEGDAFTNTVRFMKN